MMQQPPWVIPNRVDIDDRPEIANKRDRVSDWEADTIIGKTIRALLSP